MNDTDFMDVALRIAKRGLGLTFPNPSVGCLIVANQQIIGQGTTGRGGVPHAEIAALAMAGESARGATAYVTLEPCCHYGKTAPCTDALIAAGIARIVIAVRDSDERVSGKGIAQLQAADIEIIEGIRTEEARTINAGFFSVTEKGRPLVTLKLATTLDGKIATASGESKWITGEPARHYAHMLRATHDAIMVGVETVIADNPDLTCRLPGLEDRSPLRVIMDSHLRTPQESRMLKGSLPAWIITTSSAPYPGAEILRTGKNSEGRVSIEEALQLLAAKGITRLLVEGGGTLAASLLRAGLVDRLIWIHAASIIGNDGLPSVGNLGLELLANSPKLRRESMQLLGGDMVEMLSKT